MSRVSFLLCVRCTSLDCGEEDCCASQMHARHRHFYDGARTGKTTRELSSVAGGPLLFSFIFCPPSCFVLLLCRYMHMCNIERYLYIFVFLPSRICSKYRGTSSLLDVDTPWIPECAVLP
eukprot:GEMP01099741.1.p1 GENE.GEMP01099741.1~~GEMP01099741.1.p1  ORF type:complete len:120 (+),score=5.76 GEMP01099741.1:285-644(+)